MDKQQDRGCQGKATVKRGKIIPVYKERNGSRFRYRLFRLQSRRGQFLTVHSAPESIFFNKGVTTLVTAQKKKATPSATKTV